MPYASVEARRANDEVRRKRIMADPEKAAARRASTAAAMRKRRKSPEKREATYAATAAWAEKNNNRRFAHVKHKYGVTREEWERLFAEQGGVCAICRRPETAHEPRTGAVRMLAVDHCHASGRIRGLLCYRCNTAIGLLGEDPERLEAARRYLGGE